MYSSNGVFSTVIITEITVVSHRLIFGNLRKPWSPYEYLGLSLEIFGTLQVIFGSLRVIEKYPTLEKTPFDTVLDLVWKLYAPVMGSFNFIVL